MREALDGQGSSSTDSIDGRSIAAVSEEEEPLSTQPRAEDRDALRALIAAGSSAVLSVMPVFLVGALAVLIREDLGFSERSLGALVSIYYAVTAATSVIGGRVSDRLGARRALHVAVVISVAAALVIAVVADSWGVVVCGMALAALARAIIQPAANLTLAREVPVRSQGIAFGLKQSAGPSAVLVAGIAVPAIGLTVGWRWAFALVLLFALLTWVAAPRRVDSARRSRAARDSGDLAPWVLVLLAASIVPAVAAAAALGTFYVESNVDLGHATGAAGLWLTFGSICSITTRLVMGRWADHSHGGRVTMIIRMLTIGAVGFVLLGYAHSVWLLVPATVLAFAAGWGWPGLYHYMVVRLNPEAPGAATGIVVTATSIGGMLGPFLFGSLVEAQSYRLAWWAFAAVLLASAVALRYTLPAVRADIAQRAGGGARRSEDD